MAGREATLILLRHGRTAWSDRQVFTGQVDVPLSDDGRAQARAAARRLAAFRPDLVLSSDLRRATDTARAVGAASGARVAEDPRLREERLGGWEGLTRHEVAQLYPREYARWRVHHLAASANREGMPAVATRALDAIGEALDALPGRAPTLVAVTHLNTALALTGRLLGLAGRGLVAVGSLRPGAFSVLVQQESGGWTLCAHDVGVNDPADLPEAAAPATGDEPDPSTPAPGDSRGRVDLRGYC
ncbi:MAG TPA: histidine phosphatase family protein [Acidimicrobiales bacterium]|nr:histidine phosphatase family protein [Acidimicrobiales bacterium]